MSEEDGKRWDTKWQDVDFTPRPNRFLLRHENLLSRGVALDVACGLGQNAVWLAQRTYRVLGVDRSFVGLQQARARADAQNVTQRTAFVLADLDYWRPAAASVDLLCVFRFLDRTLIPALRSALRPGGLLFYETRHLGVLDQQPDSRTEFLLRDGELQEMFGDWQVLAEEDGATNAGIIARRPL